MATSTMLSQPAMPTRSTSAAVLSIFCRSGPIEPARGSHNLRKRRYVDYAEVNHEQKSDTDDEVVPVKVQSCLTIERHNANLDERDARQSHFRRTRSFHFCHCPQRSAFRSTSWPWAIQTKRGLCRRSKDVAALCDAPMWKSATRISSVWAECKATFTCEETTS